MAPTTTPDDDSTPTGQHEWSREYGQVSHQLWPPPGDPAPLTTADELLIVVLAHAGQGLHVFEGMRPIGMARASYIEFENGDRFEVQGR